MAITTVWWAGLLMLLVGAVPCWAAFQWYKWLKEDNAETTRNVVFWMKVFLIANIVGQVLNCLQLTQDVHPPAGSLIVNALLNIAMSWYFWNVTVRYQTMKNYE